MANLKLKTQFNDLVDASVVENQIEDLTSSLDDYALKVQQAWQVPTLLNSWVNYGSPFETVGYMKDEFGFVHLKGIVSTGSSDTVLFTLPVGYRTSLFQYHPNVLASGTGTVEIQPNGNVKLVVASSTLTSIDGITFKVG
jgi:hypothetical protein